LSQLTLTLTGERIYLSSSLELQVQRNEIFCDRIVLISMSHVGNCYWMVAGTVAILHNVCYNDESNKCVLINKCSMDVRMRNAHKGPYKRNETPLETYA
jgi:hypothetical protein